MKTVIVIENIDELVNGLMQTKKAGDSDKAYLPPMKIQIGEIKDSYVVILDHDEYQLAPGITFRQLFFAMCHYMNLDITEQKHHGI